MNERIRTLRQRFVESPRKVNIERALIITEVYRNNEEKPQIIKRAMALDAVLSRMSIEVREGELIVGNQTKDRRGVPLFPENAVNWILDQMDDFTTRQGDRFHITEEQKRKLRGVLPYWRGKTLRDKIRGTLPPDLTEILGHGLFANENFTMSGPGHVVPDHEMWLRRGLLSIREECQERMKALEPWDVDYPEKHNLYEACSITCGAVIKFAERYAEEALRMVRGEKEERRREELLRIAENCRRVPAKPARDFWEALQSIYYIQLTMQLETNGLAIALGRSDQILYPYYSQDTNKGSLTREEAMELIECFFLKLSEIDKIYSNEATRYLQGPAHGQTVTLGGVTREGRDATNELSYLILEADRDLHLVQPEMGVRIHPKTPQDFLKEACINVRERVTKPKFFNDEVIVRSLLGTGISLEDARDWGALGCSEPVVPGKMDSWGNSGHLNLAKCLELALNDGRCMMTQKQMGPQTGAPDRFKTMEEVLGAFREQVAYFVKYLVLYDNIIDRAHAEYAPLTSYSILTRDCLEKGKEFNHGGARYNTSSPLGVGPITTGDSLAAIKTLVYEEKALTMEELVEVLRRNFEGQEEIRQMLINRAPKFGNDDDRADDLCNEVLKIYCQELAKYKNCRNGAYVGALYYLTANIPFGMRTAATADGRRRGEPLNDGGISPVHGRDRKGITAVAKSVGKLDMERAPHGSILNQRIHASLLNGEDKLDVFTHYIRTFMNLGGWHTQFNVISSDILRHAQREPEKYRDLVIRVAGYSAYFTQLEAELQNDIIDRTEQTAY